MSQPVRQVPHRTTEGSKFSTATSRGQRSLTRPAAPTSKSRQVPTPTTRQVPKPTSRQVPKPTSRQVPKPTSRQVPKPTSRQVPATTSRQVPASTTRQVPAPTTGSSAARRTMTGNWVNRLVQDRVAAVGKYAGGLVTNVGDEVNRVGMGVGERINATTRGWGQGVADYGNSIKDAVGVGGPRKTTASNPLGLTGGQGAGATVVPPPTTTSQQASSAKNPLGLR